jgi:hypothetical protein
MTQESLKIESKDLSIEDLYKDFYTVPDFQREFIWEREQVEKLLRDNRAVEHLITFDQWNSETIDCRQGMLARLAVFVWDMPGKRKMPDDITSEFANSEGERSDE